jgi:hypothetical protein
LRQTDDSFDLGVLQQIHLHAYDSAPEFLGQRLALRDNGIASIAQDQRPSALGELTRRRLADFPRGPGQNA